MSLFNLIDEKNIEIKNLKYELKEERKKLRLIFEAIEDRNSCNDCRYERVCLSCAKNIKDHGESKCQTEI